MVPLSIGRHILKVIKSISHSDLVITSLVQVESRGDWNAIGPIVEINAVGVLQETPIYVREANRLIGFTRWKLNDRLDSIESVAMFKIISKRYNPRYDLKRACKLHNPGGGNWYYRRVKSEYDRLIEYYKSKGYEIY